jgi:hypothetical protein
MAGVEGVVGVARESVVEGVEGVEGKGMSTVSRLIFCFIGVDVVGVGCSLMSRAP